MRYYGTLGPACADRQVLTEMFKAGMTGLRLNLSHGRLSDHMDWIDLAKEACLLAGADRFELMLDLQGPELRTGSLKEELFLCEGEVLSLSPFSGDIRIPQALFLELKAGRELLMDDGKLKLFVCECFSDHASARVLIGGSLSSSKSIALFENGINIEIATPALTETDYENLAFLSRTFALDPSVSIGIMQPFVRSREDLLLVRKTLNDLGLTSAKIYAKIENMTGLSRLQDFFYCCDEIIIARGDLGNAVGLVLLPVVQKQIEACCREAGMPFMVVTQMLNSMIKNPFPTRAEVSDIANAVWDGAASVMLTGETAAGAYPAKAMRVMVETAEEMLSYMKNLDFNYGRPVIY